MNYINNFFQTVAISHTQKALRHKVVNNAYLRLYGGKITKTAKYQVRDFKFNLHKTLAIIFSTKDTDELLKLLD